MYLGGRERAKNKKKKNYINKEILTGWLNQGLKEKGEEKREGRKGERKSVWLVVISDGILINTVVQCSENKSSPNLLEKNVHIFKDA